MLGRNRAGGDRKDVGRDRVVTAASLDQEEDGYEHRDQRQRPQARVAPEAHHPGDGEEEGGAEE